MNNGAFTFMLPPGGIGPPGPPGPPASPALPFNSIQWNDAGVFGGDADLIWDNIFKIFEAADTLTPFMHADIAGGTQTTIFFGDTGAGWDNGLLSIRGNGTPTGEAILSIGTSTLDIDDANGLTQLNQGNMHIEEDLINNFFLIWNTATRDALVGINKNTPANALDVHGDALIENSTYPSGLFAVGEATANVFMGDFGGDHNSTFATINDGTQAFSFNSTNAQFTFDGAAGHMDYFATEHQFLGDVGIGAPPQDLFTVYDSTLTTTVLFIDQTNSTQRLGLDAAQVFTDIFLGETRMGDAFNSGGRTRMVISDVLKTFVSGADNGYLFTSSAAGFGLNQVPTINSGLAIALTTIQNFADNAAAVLGGLVTGEVYRTSTPSGSFLKIVE